MSSLCLTPYKEGAIGFGERIQDVLRERIFDRKVGRIKLEAEAFPGSPLKIYGVDSTAGLLDSRIRHCGSAKGQGGGRLLVFKKYPAGR